MRFIKLRTECNKLANKNADTNESGYSGIVVPPEEILDILAERDRLLEALINLHGVADVHDQSGMKAVQDAGAAISEAMRTE